MPNIKDERKKVIEDPIAREQMFRYHYNRGYFGSLDEHCARGIFVDTMRNPHSIESKIMIDAYLPNYERRIRREEKVKHTRGKYNLAKGIALTGIAALALSTAVMDDGAQKKFIRTLGLGGALVALASAAVVYNRERH